MLMVGVSFGVVYVRHVFESQGLGDDHALLAALGVLLLTACFAGATWLVVIVWRARSDGG